MPERIKRFCFCCAAYGTGKSLFSCCGAGSRSGYFIFPDVSGFLGRFVATRTLFPVLVGIVSPGTACKVVPERGDLFIIGNIVAARTDVIIFPAGIKAGCRLTCFLSKIMTDCRNRFGFCFKTSGASIGFYACCRASRRKRYFIFPSMCRGLVCSFTTRAFFPMVVIVLLPYVACKIMPEWFAVRSVAG